MNKKNDRPAGSMSRREMERAVARMAKVAAATPPGGPRIVMDSLPDELAETYGVVSAYAADGEAMVRGAEAAFRGKAGLLWRTNKAIELLNSKMNLSLRQYGGDDKTVGELRYIFLNASQAYSKEEAITQEQLETPMYVNNNL